MLPVFPMDLSCEKRRILALGQVSFCNVSLKASTKDTCLASLREVSRGLNNRVTHCCVKLSMDSVF